MSRTARIAAVAAIAVVVLVVVGVVGALELRRSRAERAAPTDVAVAAAGSFDDGPRIVFRSTAPGDLFGRVAVVPLDDPAGPRDVTPAACDRVDAVPGRASCLRTGRGVAPTFSASVLDASWRDVATWPLPGVPSRTRLSDDGTRVSTTAFVTGHSYAATGFSTETVIHDLSALPDGEPAGLGNIEEYALLVDGEKIAPVDRNLWGVTFVDDDTFYATAQSKTLGHTWLVHGDVAGRTLTAVAEDVECPSLSPDGTRIAFKRDVGDAPQVHWTPAVLDLASGDVTVLDAEQRDVDDQIEWLDDATILYGLPRADQPGVTDVWRLPADGSGSPAVLVPEAWSPSVVR
ncbi:MULTISPECIES: TolB family protein [unclassified Isoptericola]|uniref:TolB family protein n=1 Tax=unclassified Isoptericola TaxID=2623355 RepID=UPI00365C1BBF